MSLKVGNITTTRLFQQVEPHEKPDLSCIKDRTIWKVGGYTISCKVDYGL